MRVALLAIFLSGCVGALAAGSYITGQVIAAYMPDPLDQKKPADAGIHQQENP